MNRLWIFDFDGTLVNSEKSIKDCYIKITKQLIPERIEFVKNIIIGPTLEETISLILTKDKINLKETFIEKFKNEYDERLIFNTTTYPNASSVLKALHSKKDKIAILTNKRKIPTQKLIKYFGWEKSFVWTACLDENINATNKSELLKSQNTNYSEYKKIYLVGDTLGDAIAAKDNKIPFILAKYGYGINQDWLNTPIFKKISCLNELLTI